MTPFAEAMTYRGLQRSYRLPNGYGLITTEVASGRTEATLVLWDGDELAADILTNVSEPEQEAILRALSTLPPGSDQ